MGAVRPFPAPKVVAAFGAAGDPSPLEGGQGHSWLIGDLVLKPLDQSELELEWQAGVIGSMVVNGFRVSHPQRALDGSLVVDGWCAWERLAGLHEERRWAEIIAAGDRFHTALRDFPRPEFITRRADRWAIGARIAWDELSPEAAAPVKHVSRLVAGLRTIEATNQLIHGDLTGNVLFAEHLPPAIIDFSPYWRPAAFASAIVVADALVWEGAGEHLLAEVEHIERFPQFLLRALIYRIVSDRFGPDSTATLSDDADHYLPAVDLACQLAEAT